MILLKIFFLIIITFLFSSCDHGKLSFDDEMGYSYIKKVNTIPIPLIINVKFNKNNNNSSNNKKREEIINKIKKDFNYRSNISFVYFYNLNSQEISKLKNKYEKTLLIDMKIGKSLNYTILLDFISIFLPTPAPQ